MNNKELAQKILELSGGEKILHMLLIVLLD